MKTLQQLSSSAKVAKEHREKVKDDKAKRSLEEAFSQALEGEAEQSSSNKGTK